MRVETLIPEVKVRYMPGLDEARWYSIHCEEIYPAWGQTVEHCYQIATPDGKDRPVYTDYIVTGKRCPNHQSFPARALEKIVRDTAICFACDVVQWRGDIGGNTGFARLKESELWVIVEPMPEMAEDEVW